MATTLSEILHAEESKHSLTLFTPTEVHKLEKSLFEKDGKPFLKCLVRAKDIQAKPEEIVRQLWISRLQHDYEFPLDRLRVEHAIQFGREVKKADIAVMDTIGRGPYKDDGLSVDHIIPRAAAPELDKVVANLELVPLRMSEGKRDNIGDRQRALARQLHAAGLLGESGLAAVTRMAK